jgi:hypothetical protein
MNTQKDAKGFGLIFQWFGDFGGFEPLDKFLGGEPQGGEK